MKVIDNYRSVSFSLYNIETNMVAAIKGYFKGSPVDSGDVIRLFDLVAVAVEHPLMNMYRSNQKISSACARTTKYL